MKSSSNDFRPLINTIANFIVYLFGVCGFIIIAYLFNKAGLSQYRISLLAISIIIVLIILCNNQLQKLTTQKSLLSKIDLSDPIMFVLFILVAHVVFIALALIVGDLIALTLDYSKTTPMSLSSFLEKFTNFLPSMHCGDKFQFNSSYYMWIVGIISLILLLSHKFLKDVSSSIKNFISITYIIFSAIIPVLILVICLLLNDFTLYGQIFAYPLIAMVCLAILYYSSKSKDSNKITPIWMLIIGGILAVAAFPKILLYWNKKDLNVQLFWCSLFLLAFFIFILSAILLVMALKPGKSVSDGPLFLIYRVVNTKFIPIIIMALSISIGSVLLTKTNNFTGEKLAHVNLFYISLTVVAVIAFFPFVFYTFIQIPFYLYSFLRDRLEIELHTRNKRDIINIHFHLLNSEYVPDSYLSSIIPSDIPFTFSKRILRLPLLVDFVEKFLLFFPRENEKLTGEWIKLLARKMKPDSFTNRLDKPESEWSVIEVYLDEMEKAGEFKMAVPLLMDLNDHSYNSNPDVHYTIQIDEISEIAKKYPFKIIPFVMFDPRRKGAVKIVKDALEKKGFIGVKLYPSMGYDLDFSPTGSNDADTNEALIQIYEYCAKHQIPITIHSSKGGNIAETISARKDISDGYSNPDKWEDIFKYNENNQIEINGRKYPKVDLKNLIINLAHFGSDLHEKTQIGTRAKITEDLMMKSEYNVYTDVACNLLELNKNNKDTYFKNLKIALKNSDNSKKIMFGTDWMMTRRTFREKDFADKYVEFFEEWKNKEIKNKKNIKNYENDFFVLNAIRFVFPLPPNPPLPQNSGKYGRIPDRIAEFYLKSHETFNEDEKQDWINKYLPQNKKEILGNEVLGNNGNTGNKVEKELMLFYEIYIHEELKKNNFLLFTMDDIPNFDKLMKGLQNLDNDYKTLIFEGLGEQCKEIITHYTNGDSINQSQRESIISGLNDILDKQDFSDSELFEKAKLATDSSKDEISSKFPDLYKNKDISLGDMRILNHLLLENILSIETPDRWRWGRRRRRWNRSSPKVSQVINASEALKSLKWLIKQFAKLD